MIKSLSIINNFNQLFKLELENPWETGLAIEKIEGLGPPKANINTIDLAGTDGSVFNSSRLDKRNVVLTIVPFGDPKTKSIEDSRLLVYHIFPIKKEIRLIIETDNRIAETFGYVESIEPDIFSKQEKFNISIICPDSYFRVDDDYIDLWTIKPRFEFPFSNESLNENLIIFGEYMFIDGTPHTYPGDIETGMEIFIHATGYSKNPILSNKTTGMTMKLDTSKIKLVTKDDIDDLESGDDIYINTNPGYKEVTLTRNSVEYNIISTLPKTSIEWLTVVKGTNVFTCIAEENTSNLQVTFKTQILYEGM